MTDKAPEQKKVLSWEDFINEADVEYAEAPGFVIGTVVRLRSLTSEDVITWQEETKIDNRREAGLKLILKSLCDANGQRIADEKNPAQLAQIRRKSHKVCEKIIAEVLKLNGMTLKQQTDNLRDEIKKV